MKMFGENSETLSAYTSHPHYHIFLVNSSRFHQENHIETSHNANPNPSELFYSLIGILRPQFNTEPHKTRQSSLAKNGSKLILRLKRTETQQMKRTDEWFTFPSFYEQLAS